MSAAVESAIGADFRQYICHACGFIYSEADGDPDSGLAAGTRFEDIPQDWYCPLCGVTKADFELYVAPSLDAMRQRVASRTPATGRRADAPGVVIVGAGRAGWQAAQALRELSDRLPITLVSACDGAVYDKPLLSVALARQLPLDQLVRLAGDREAQRLNLRLLADTHAIRIDTATRQLRTTRGNLPYDHLVLAHGASAVVPPAMPASMCWRINHLSAYLRLRRALGNDAKEVLIVGAGLIGSELANDLAIGGHRVTLLAAQSEPLARWHSQQAGQRVLEAWKELAIRFVGGVQVAGIAKSAARYLVTTVCGQQFEVDQVVAAVGLQTPERLALGAGLAWDQGIAVTPDTLRTSVERIHALGDCITVHGQASRYIEPIARQARTIATAICGGTSLPYENRPPVVRVKTTSLPLTLH